MAGSSNQADDEMITDMNVTPLVDVSLVLVIIFMAVAPMALTTGIKVLESSGKAATGKVAASENVEVKLYSDGRITINGKEIEFAALYENLVREIPKSKDKMVMISADKMNKVGKVVKILDVARRAGAKKLAILKHEDAPSGTGS